MNILIQNDIEKNILVKKVRTFSNPYIIGLNQKLKELLM